MEKYRKWIFGGAVIIILILAVVMVWSLVSRGGDDGTISVVPDPGVPQGQLPGMTGEEDELDDGSNPEIIENPDVDQGTTDLEGSVEIVLEDLFKEFPGLEGVIQNPDLTDEEVIGQLYDEIIKVYEAEGTKFFYDFLKEAGLMEGLNLSSAYLDFLLAYEEGGFEGAAELARVRGLVDDQDRLRMVLILDTVEASDVDDYLAEIGADIIAHYEYEMEIGIPLSRLEAIGNSRDAVIALVKFANSSHIVSIRVPEPVIQNSFLFDEGPGRTGADLWHQAGITGAGVKVAVIDMGFGNYLDLIGSELPSANQLVLPPGITPEFLNGQQGIHGTACAEIVHEMAPDAIIYLAYIDGSSTSLREMVDWLISEDVDIISYSATFLVSPMDGTGFAVEAIKKAPDAGILWMNASGNYAQTHILEDFLDDDGDGFHEFQNGSELLAFEAYGGAGLGFVWEDNWSGPNIDLDIFIYSDDQGQNLVVSSTEEQSGLGSQWPAEYISYNFDYDTYYIAIENLNPGTNPWMNLLSSGGVFAYSVPSTSMGAPGGYADILAVGATNVSNDKLEPYSSQGPTMDGRIKPDISAPADVSSYSYPSGFTGTSASTPHVAGAAALLYQAFPDANYQQIREYLLSNAVDFGAPGFDSVFGYGRLDLGALPSGQLGDDEEPVEPTPEPQDDPYFMFTDVWQEHDAVVGGIPGMWIHSRIEIDNYAGREAAVIARFYDAGQQGLPPLIDTNGFFVDEGNQVAVYHLIVPQTNQGRFQDFKLFMPYSELELGQGEYRVGFDLTIYNDDFETATEMFGYEFTYTNGARNDIWVQFSDVAFNQNVTKNGDKGLEILVDFDVFNYQGQDGIVAAYFYFDTSNERPLRDFNDVFTSPNGNVAVGKDFTPVSDEAGYSDFSLFIPYDELHLQSDEFYELKFYVAVYTGDDLDQVNSSDWVYLEVVGP